MADACPLVVCAPLALSGDVLCGRLSRGINNKDAGLDQNTAGMVVVCGAKQVFIRLWGTKKIGPFFLGTDLI